MPGAHRHPPRRWVLPLAAAGVLVSVTIGAFMIGIGWHADERQALVSRVVTACRADTVQTYLMYEACREANQQAVSAGVEVVPLPVLRPTPMPPTRTR